MARILEGQAPTSPEGGSWWLCIDKLSRDVTTQCWETKGLAAWGHTYCMMADPSCYLSLLSPNQQIMHPGSSPNQNPVVSVLALPTTEILGGPQVSIWEAREGVGTLNVSLNKREKELLNQPQNLLKKFYLQIMQGTYRSFDYKVQSSCRFWGVLEWTNLTPRTGSELDSCTLQFVEA